MCWSTVFSPTVIGIQFVYGCSILLVQCFVCSPENVGNELLDQRINIQFLVKLENNAAAIYTML
jgi:hypothetical protein